LSSVYVAGHETSIARSGRSLIVRRGADKERVPLEGIDSVVMLGAVHATMDALAACVDHHVRVAVLRRNGRLRFTVGPPASGNVHLRVAQVCAATDDAAALRLTKLFIAGKLQNSRRVMMRWARDAPSSSARRRIGDRADLIAERLGRLSTAPTADHVRGIEGDAARVYFTALGTVLSDTPWRFASRIRRPPRDPVNALLGFAYALVVTELVGALEAIGLDHQVGFLHRVRSGRPSLALDLAEEMRPLTDRFVVGMLRRREIGAGDFVWTPGGACYLADEGRAKFLRRWEQAKQVELAHPVVGRAVERWALPSVQATLLARHLRGDLPTYPPFVIPA
jgi:CRISPR-associated protein Cas1